MNSKITYHREGDYYIPDESNDSVIYMKEPVPISVGVKPVKFCEDYFDKTN